MSWLPGGYEVVGYGPGRDVYPSAVMRLKPDVIEREHPVPEFAATVMQLDIRVRALEADLERYQDTHAETHRFDDARAREFGECNATLLRASLKQTVQLAPLERRLAALQETVDSVDSRSSAVEEVVHELATALCLYRDTHLQTHTYLDARLGELERRLVAAEDRLNGSNELRLLALESSVKRLDAHCHAD